MMEKEPYIRTILWSIALAVLLFVAAYAAPRPDPLRLLAASVARSGQIADPVDVALILHKTLGADLVRAVDFFGRSDFEAGQSRFSLDDRAPLSRQGLEISLVVKHPNGKPEAPGPNAAIGDVKAELDINDWGVISTRSWLKESEALGKLYPSVVLPDTPGQPCFELPAAPGYRLIMTVAPRKTDGEPVWFVHITQYRIKAAS